MMLSGWGKARSTAAAAMVVPAGIRSRTVRGAEKGVVPKGVVPKGAAWVLGWKDSPAVLDTIEAKEVAGVTFGSPEGVALGVVDPASATVFV